MVVLVDLLLSHFIVHLLRRFFELHKYQLQFWAFSVWNDLSPELLIGLFLLYILDQQRNYSFIFARYTLPRLVIFCAYVPIGLVYLLCICRPSIFYLNESFWYFCWRHFRMCIYGYYLFNSLRCRLLSSTRNSMFCSLSTGISSSIHFILASILFPMRITLGTICHDWVRI